MGITDCAWGFSLGISGVHVADVTWLGISRPFFFHFLMITGLGKGWHVAGNGTDCYEFSLGEAMGLRNERAWS